MLIAVLGPLDQGVRHVLDEFPSYLEYPLLLMVLILPDPEPLLQLSGQSHGGLRFLRRRLIATIRILEVVTVEGGASK